MTEQRLIDANELITAFPCGETVRTECVRATIGHMPTIEERKTGKWRDGFCSVCGERSDYYLSGTIWIDELSNFCPNCGARMKGE